MIESEKERRNERLRGHYNNNVWEKRDTPPDDWNKPLPENLQNNDEVWYFTLTFWTLITINCNTVYNHTQTDQDGMVCQVHNWNFNS